MDKLKSNNLDAAILALSTFIFETAASTIVDFEEKEELKDISREFNAQPFLKRFLDFSIVYFWATSTSCGSYYEHDDFLRICDGIEENIFKRFSEVETEQKIPGIVLKDYVKGRDELSLLYRQFPVGDETKVNFNVLLGILINKRIFDYNSALCLDLAQQVKKIPSLFFKHIFGKEKYEYENWKNILLHAIFLLRFSSFSCACAKLIVEVEHLLANNADLNFNFDTIFRIIKKKQNPLDAEIERTNPFIKALKNIVIREDDCGTFNGITVQSIMRDGKIIRDFQDRIIHRFALEQIVNVHTNQKIVRSGEEITKEKLEIISGAGIKEIRIRSALTCESENGVCLKCYGRNNIVGNPVKRGEDVGIEAAYFWNEIVISEEIKELLGPTSPKDSAILSEIDGVIEVNNDKDNLKVLLVKSNTGLVREYRVFPEKTVQVKDRESVIAGQQLTGEKISSHEIVRICGEKILFKYLTQQILPHISIANFDERMVELLLRKMITLKIEEPGDTNFKYGQTVNKSEFCKENVLAIKKRKRPAVASSKFLGMKL